MLDVFKTRNTTTIYITNYVSKVHKANTNHGSTLLLVEVISLNVTFCDPVTFW